MPPMDDDDALTPVVRAGERALSLRAGRLVRLEQPERLTAPERRTLVLRCQVVASADADLPETVILKWANTEDYRPNEPEGAVARLFNDWAGTLFLSGLPEAAGLAPRCLGGDRAMGLVVLEDLGAGATLVDPLLGADATAAERALLALMRTLGRLHAATVGREDAYRAVRATLGPVTAATPVHTPGRLRAQLPEIGAALTRAGLALDARAETEVETTLTALEQPGPFWAYTHGDPCPDNDFLAPDGTVRLIDFEMGAYRHALIDGVYGLMHFPTCWCAGRIPGATLARMEAAYRGELARGCPAAEDDAKWGEAVTHALAYWLLASLAWLLEGALREEEEWGIAGVRPRLVARVESFAREVSKRDEHLPALAAFAERLSAELRRRWPPESCELALYPAFRSGKR